MIIWRGWGFLVAVFAFGASLVTELVTESVTGDDGFYQREAWPLALASVVAGIVTWLVGKKLIAVAALPFVLRRLQIARLGGAGLAISPVNSGEKVVAARGFGRVAA
jgi:hypothetical protein